MGERQNQPFQLSFNPALKVDFQGSRITSDGGLILVRELDERLGLGDLIAEHLSDSRRGKKYATAAGRPVPPVCLQPRGRL
jgi:Transposase DDE domain group 1